MTSPNQSLLNWNKVARFNFTYAITGGAWLEWQPEITETSDGRKSSIYMNWFSFDTIAKHKGQDWIDAQIKAQGWMTGCWVDCVPVTYRAPLKPVAINGKPVSA